MIMPPPAAPKIYHIVHVDRLSSIVADGSLYSHAEIAGRSNAETDVGTTIGMDNIKQRRLSELTLASHPNLYVGQCVPFYFCPRSVMLYMIHRANRDELSYRDGQGPILHLEADLRETVRWADANQRRWAFTLSNAGAYYFEDRSDLAKLDELDWAAIDAHYWQDCKEPKQAEFLVERSFPWQLVRRIGVSSRRFYTEVRAVLAAVEHEPHLEIIPDWYY